MRIVTNQKLVQRNATIGKYGTIAGLVVLIGGVVVSLNPAMQNNPTYQWIPFATLVIGFILSQVGTYYMNRYVREPRADKVLEGALKGFDDKYHLYNYYLPGPHFLVSPSGLFALVPKFQAGTVEWDGKRWKHKNANALLSLFGQDGLANPNAEAAADVDGIAKFLAKKVGGDLPPVQAIVVFYNPNVTINAEDPPIPVVHVKQLKEHMRRMGKGQVGSAGRPGYSLSPEQIAKLDAALKL